jgi:hypothetical protein
MRDDRYEFVTVFTGVVRNWPSEIYNGERTMGKVTLVGGVEV